MIDMSSDERQQLDAGVARLHTDGWTSDFPTLLLHWEKLVAHVERGYEMIAPLDSRLRAVTRELASPIPFAGSQATGWWWFRVPVVLSDELAADLFGNGYSLP
jgi:hypothetical protein